MPRDLMLSAQHSQSPHKITHSTDIPNHMNSATNHAITMQQPQSSERTTIIVHGMIGFLILLLDSTATVFRRAHSLDEWAHV